MTIPGEPGIEYKSEYSCSSIKFRKKCFDWHHKSFQDFCFNIWPEDLMEILNKTIDGTLNRTLDWKLNGTLNRTLDGTLGGTQDGTMDGTMNWTLDGTLEATETSRTGAGSCMGPIHRV